MEETERRDAELTRCVAAMAAGDRAFIVTFAERFGGLVTELALAAGAPTVDDGLVADVAVEVFDRAADTALGARELVESVVTDVVSGPEGVAGPPGASCGGGTTEELWFPRHRRYWSTPPALWAA